MRIERGFIAEIYRKIRSVGAGSQELGSKICFGLLAPCSLLPATTVPGVKIGIQTRSLRQPIRQALTTAARLGAAGVEIDARSELRPGDVSQTGLREFHKLLDDTSLRVSAVAFPTRRGYDVPDDLERRVLATQEAMRFAADLRTDVVIIRVGRVPDDRKRLDLRRLVEALTALGMFGERIGARLALQTADVSPQDLGPADRGVAGAFGGHRFASQRPRSWVAIRRWKQWKCWGRTCCTSMPATRCAM